MQVLCNTAPYHPGHVRRRDNDHVLSKAAEMEVEGVGPRGRPKKTWKLCVEQDMREREYWGGKYSQPKRVEETHRPSNSVRNKKDIKQRYWWR